MTSYFSCNYLAQGEKPRKRCASQKVGSFERRGLGSRFSPSHLALGTGRDGPITGSEQQNAIADPKLARPRQLARRGRQTRQYQSVLRLQQSFKSINGRGQLRLRSPTHLSALLSIRGLHADFSPLTGRKMSPLSLDCPAFCDLPATIFNISHVFHKRQMGGQPVAKVCGVDHDALCENVAE